LIEALPGDKVVFTVNGMNTEKLRCGFICSDANNDPAQEVSNFIAQVCTTSFAIGIYFETGTSLH
jgi:translation elongation factor EF-1alpha